MNETIIYLLLFIVIYIIYRNLKNNDIIYINKNNTFDKKIKNDITSNTDKIKYLNYHDENVVIVKGDTPAFRGYIDEYKLGLIKEEGGSKPFNDIVIDNSNLTINQVNYNKYESYRRKPLSLNNLR